MTGLISYLAFEAWLMGLLALIVSKSAKTGIVSALHYALLSTMAYQGLSCLGFAYMSVPLSFSSMNWSLLAADAAAIITAVRMKAFSGVERYPASLKSFYRTEAVALAVSYLAATMAGIIFFSIELIPSSMTGDPARHFQFLTDLAQPGPANAMKPIYYLWAGVFSNLAVPLARDQLFVLFNIFVLGLVTSSASLLMIKIIGQQKWHGISLFALLTAFGFPFFALQYGYYPLLLSAAFLFSALALLLDYVKTDSGLVYALITLLACGTILTHSYFAPDFFLIAFALTLWQSRQMQRNPWRQIVRHAPYWILAGCVVISSNYYFQSLGQIIQARGFVTDDFSHNILVFAAFAAPYFLANDKSRHNQILLLFAVCSAAFSIAMYALYAAGFSSPYYVNRNQLVLIPLLIIGTMGALQRWELEITKLATLTKFALMLLVVVPYIYYRNPPLAMSDVRILDLLHENSGFLYFVNAETASYSPLQFTARDRALLVSPKHGCFDKTPEKMAVLGTDHQVIWFGTYASLYPSLFVRDDMFCDQPSYLANYKLWNEGDGGAYIAVVKHTNYLIPRKILREIRASAELVCEGDSFAVYRKPPH